MTNPDIETLKRLAATVERSVAFLEASEMRLMSDKEIARWRANYSEFDFVIGDFAVKELK